LDRHRVVAAVAASLLAAALAGCGGSAASSSPSPQATEAPTEAPVTNAPPSQAPPSEAAPSASAAAHSTVAAICPGVAIRKQPAKDGDVLVRTKTGTKVRVAAVVMGDAYTAGSCGVSGTSWLKVDRIGGKSVKTLYGVPFGYVAAGFFQ
jgi:hypothetical protein